MLHMFFSSLSRVMRSIHDCIALTKKSNIDLRTKSQVDIVIPGQCSPQVDIVILGQCEENHASTENTMLQLLYYFLIFTIKS